MPVHVWTGYRGYVVGLLATLLYVGGFPVPHYPRLTVVDHSYPVPGCVDLFWRLPSICDLHPVDGLIRCCCQRPGPTTLIWLRFDLITAGVVRCLVVPGWSLRVVVVAGLIYGLQRILRSRVDLDLQLRLPRYPGCCPTITALPHGGPLIAPLPHSHTTAGPAVTLVDGPSPTFYDYVTVTLLVTVDCRFTFGPAPRCCLLTVNSLDDLTVITFLILALARTTLQLHLTFVVPVADVTAPADCLQLPLLHTVVYGR